MNATSIDFTQVLMAQMSDDFEIKRNDYIVNEGQTDLRIFYVQSGTVRIFVRTEEGEQNIRFGYAGNFIVSLDSFLKDTPTVYIIQAIKTSRIRTLSKYEFLELIQRHEAQNWWLSLLENLIIQQLEREIDILTTYPAERYERVLKRSPQLFQEIPHKHIANYLRMTPETLSRLQKKS
ncbi:MAG: Crp/Fnr family transcriptional regulator [Fluviicola sp.]|jgi:CRP-like cAMP-binding protein